MRTDYRGFKGGSVIFAALAAMLLLQPDTSQALTACQTTAEEICGSVASPSTADCDQDGITDYEECWGIKTCNGFTTCVQTPIEGYYKYDTSTPYVNPAVKKLNPAKPDLFFIATDTAGGDLPSTSLMLQALGNDPTQALKVYSDGLSVTTHKLQATNLIPGTDRGVIVDTGNIPLVKAAWIKENTCNPKLTTCPESVALGSTKTGVSPKDLNVVSTIYTQKIWNDVDTKCKPNGSFIKCSVLGAGVTNYTTTTPVTYSNAPIAKYYIKQVIAHEMGHGSKLAANVTNYYHYSRSTTVMDTSATFSKGIYTIPVAFDPIKDPAMLSLK